MEEKEPKRLINTEAWANHVLGQKHDPVNHPKHYTQGGIECIEAIEAALTPEEFRGFLKGQVFKYNWRLGHKDEPVQEVGKLLWYGDKLQRHLIKESKK